MYTWAVVKPYINTKGIEDGTCLVMWVLEGKDKAIEIADKMNKEENTNKYMIEYVETFETN